MVVVVVVVVVMEVVVPLPPYVAKPVCPFHPLDAVGASGGVSAAVSAGVGVALASRSGRMGWELSASDSALKWASVSVLWHSRISFYSTSKVALPDHLVWHR